jgi:putative transposase
MWEKGHGFPRFKKPGRMRSFIFPQLGKNSLINNTIKLPKIGTVKFRKSREIPEGAVVKQARIVKRASGWFVMLTVQWELSVPEIKPHGEPLGIDVGLNNFIATSSNLLIKRPNFFRDAERKRKHCCNSVSLRNKKAQIIGKKPYLK